MSVNQSGSADTIVKAIISAIEEAARSNWNARARFQFDIANGAAVGVTLAGERLAARHVVGSVRPKLVFGDREEPSARAAL